MGTNATIEHDVGYMVLFVFMLVIGPCYVLYFIIFAIFYNACVCVCVNTKGLIFGLLPKLIYTYVPDKFNDKSTNVSKGISQAISPIIFVSLLVISELLEMLIQKLCQYSLSTMSNNFIFCYPVLLATNITQIYMFIVIPYHTLQWYLLLALLFIKDFHHITRLFHFVHIFLKFRVFSCCFHSNSFSDSFVYSHQSPPVTSPDQAQVHLLLLCFALLCFGCRDHNVVCAFQEHDLIYDDVTELSHTPSQSLDDDSAHSQSDLDGTHINGDSHRRVHATSQSKRGEWNSTDNIELEPIKPQNRSPNNQTKKWTVYDHHYAYELYKTAYSSKCFMIAQCQAKLIVLIVVGTEIAFDWLVQKYKMISFSHATWTLNMKTNRIRFTYFFLLTIIFIMSLLLNYVAVRYVNYLMFGMKKTPRLNDHSMPVENKKSIFSGQTSTFAITDVTVLYGRDPTRLFQFHKTKNLNTNHLPWTDMYRELHNIWLMDSNYWGANLIFLLTVTNFLISFGFAFFLPL
ncbi:hypothetical protein RFI_28580 [Reticulomyxa filosa]|uniref:Uncharacterized protein n=1 Tax=Reticulomyxa filosa TaxID=46433 RepID=X6M5A3_RETFI|nr:hypothetical protein RFI_28580 [Reticulomyxa filosa]|eukprot:ETO08806.1 hypothetical protein RFI_28580 [Reticulomyxa filosa]